MYINGDVLKDSLDEKITVSSGTKNYVRSLEPGSFSVFDRDPEEQDQNDFKRFLLGLNRSQVSDGIISEQVKKVTEGNQPRKLRAQSLSTSPLHGGYRTLPGKRERSIPESSRDINPRNMQQNMEGKITDGRIYVRPNSSDGSSSSTLDKGARSTNARVSSNLPTVIGRLISPSSQDDCIFFPRSQTGSPKNSPLGHTDPLGHSPSIEMRPVKDVPIPNSRTVREGILRETHMTPTPTVQPRARGNMCTSGQSTTALGGLAGGRACSQSRPEQSKTMSNPSDVAEIKSPISQENGQSTLEDRSARSKVATPTTAYPTGVFKNSAAEAVRNSPLKNASRSPSAGYSAKPVVFLEYGNL
ncbi:unnamed protein product [Dibothriocephalus latus]|uniref:Uncharacterized protein n=1 Tax=Dibothriocephalus latus TaxID=60516 RepID=A0A3P6SS55_DIBLA|nr:unnamed protein product [Dibothriocephalus latus]